MDDSSQGTMEQARSQVQNAADSAREGAAEVKSRAGEGVREQVETRSTDIGAGARSVAEAIRHAGRELREQENEMPAKVMEASAERIERVGSYLESAQADELLDRVEEFARRQPWLVAAGGFTVGLVTSRLLKASSTDRYRRRGGNGNGRSSFSAQQPRSDLTGSQATYPPPATPALPDVPAAGSPAREPL